MDAASRRRVRSREHAVVAVSVLAAVMSASWMWGYTVDDALISVRYARHLAEGAGYRFNAFGPVTDGVTPLPWAFLLAPFAHESALAVLTRAKCIGLGAWALGAGVWGLAVARAKSAWWVKAVAIAALALALPVAANAVSGMETAFAMSLATIAASMPTRVRTSALCAGLAASLRPEMAPWAIALSAGYAVISPPSSATRRVGRVVTSVAIAVAPFAACVLARLIFFGRPAPLAVFAKPSDLAYGLTYAAGGFIASLAPILLLAPRAIARARGPALPIALAGVAHFLSVIAVGGDWMAYWRLLAPIVPSLLYAFVLASPRAHWVATAIRGGLALGVGVTVIATGGTRGRSVDADRRALIDRARGPLAGARRIAALDIGWVSAASDAEIIDLAGVTDPEIAALPGGHTSKRVGAEMLLARDPDVLLIYSPMRAVEARLLDDDAIRAAFDEAEVLPLGAHGDSYLVLRRKR